MSIELQQKRKDKIRTVLSNTDCQHVLEVLTEYDTETQQFVPATGWVQKPEITDNVNTDVSNITVTLRELQQPGLIERRYIRTETDRIVSVFRAATIPDPYTPEITQQVNTDSK